MDILSPNIPLSKLCNKCGKNPRPHYSTWCNQCLNTYKRARYNPLKKRDENLRKNHGVSLEEYDLMFFRQGGTCALCQLPETVIDHYTGKPKSLGVDHHHETGQVRELLCDTCNQLVGWVEKDRGRVNMALKYLKKHDM